VRERRFWASYMHAYEEAIRATASTQAPWFVVPADHKWFTRLVVAAAVVNAVDGLNLSYPRVSAEKMRELRSMRSMLERER
jgi:polyphosphate kinase 2 (PPK2 family)